MRYRDTETGEEMGELEMLRRCRWKQSGGVQLYHASDLARFERVEDSNEVSRQGDGRGMMIEHLGAHRFRRAANAAETNAIDALEAAMDAMRNGEICPLAITVVTLDEHGGIKHFSAGDVSVTTRVGMMEVVKSLFTSIAVEP